MIVERYPNLKTRLVIQFLTVKLSLYLTEKLARWPSAFSVSIKKEKKK